MESLAEIGRIFIVMGIKSFTEKTYPVNSDGGISRSNFCELNFHCEKTAQMLYINGNGFHNTILGLTFTKTMRESNYD